VKRWAIYNALGEITAVLSAPADCLAANMAPGEAALELEMGIDSERVYIDLSSNPALAVRPVMPLVTTSLSMTTTHTLTITGIPEGALLHHPDGQTVVDDGYVEWGAEEAGRYQLRLECFPYVTVTLYAEVTEA